MATTYRISLKSCEERGATQPNIIELDFANDADAQTFGLNCQRVFSVHCVSVDKILTRNYALPYPNGTNGMTRTALTNGVGGWNQLRVYDTPLAFAPVARAAALEASGLLLYTASGLTSTAPTSVNVQVFSPGVSY